MGRKDKIIFDEDSEAPQQVGARMRLARQRGIVSLTDMSKRLDYSKSYLSTVENGFARPSRELVEKYERELDIEHGELTSFLDELEQEPFAQEQQIREDWGEAPTAQIFYGRQEELDDLEQWIVNNRCQVVAILGIGGIGKSALAARLVEQAKYQFDKIFWRSLQNTPPAENILRECIQFLSNQEEDELPEDEDEQVAILLKYMQKQRCLIVLDNLESILRGDGRVGVYKENCEGYGLLIQRAGESKHKSCLLLTSREKPREIPRLEGKILPVRSMHLTGLQLIEAQKILENEGLFGSDKEWENLIDLYKGNPLALKLISATIREIFEGDIAEFLQEGAVVFGDIRDLLGQQFQRLSGLEQSILYWLAIEREAVTLHQLRENIAHPISKGTLFEALESLQRRFIIENLGKASFTLQPVIMEYVTDDFVDKVLKEIQLEKFNLFETHALIKAQAKDYVRNIQVRLILNPIIRHFLVSLEKGGSEKKLKGILSTLQEEGPQISGYTAGNVLNLLVFLNADLRNSDFSYLTVWQAYLQHVPLQGVNFAYADLSKSVFVDTFGSIFSVALSSYKELLAAGTANGEIRVWDTASGMPMRTYKGHTEWVRSVAFSPTENILASGSEDQTVRLWDVHTGEILNILREHSSTVYSVSFSHDGKTIASGSDDQTVRLWSVHTGEILKVLRGHTSRVFSVAFSPDGKIVASGSGDQTVRLWDVHTGECLRLLQGHSDRVWSVAFSPFENILASGSDDQTIRLWNVSTGENLKVLHGSRVYSLAFNSDGKTIASGGDGQTVQLWSVANGESLKTLQGHGSRVYSLAFNPDGKTIASGCEDQTIRLWNFNTGEYLRALSGHTHWVWSVSFGSGGLILASGSEDRSVRIWNAITGECLWTLTLEGHINRVYSVIVSPDEGIIASSSGDQTIKLWELSTGKCLRTLLGHTSRVYAVDISPDGRMIASGSEDRTLKLWDVSTGRCLKTLSEHTDGVRSVSFSPDGKTIASGSDDQTVKLWDVETGSCFNTLQGHTNWVWSVAFSSDGNTLASGGEDGTIRLWHASTGECLKKLQGHGRTIYSVAFSPDGKTVASGSQDGIIELWSIGTEECLQTLRSDRPYERMNIKGVKGLTDNQLAILKTLGAVEEPTYQLN
jgi:WD40 repeat protein/transcriptional regulator with XRE-family HTH domain